MAAPQFVPADPLDDGFVYRSPDHVPEAWTATRPADLGRRPYLGELTRLGHQGPDQGYALLLADKLRGELVLAPGERADDVVRGANVVALRRASLFGRAPVIHDLRLALGLWGFLDPSAPAELVELRQERFRGLADVAHHYDQLRDLADSVPESTLRMTAEQVIGSAKAAWRQLLGAQHLGPGSNRYA